MLLRIRKRLRQIWGLFLLAGSLFGQCGLQNQATCGSFYNLPGPPPAYPIGSYFSGLEGSLAMTRTSIAALPQPKILLTAENLPCAAGWLSTSVPVFGAQIINYSTLLKNSAGVVVQDCNLWMSALASSNTYSPSTITITSDCPVGATYAVNAGAPAGTSPISRCAALAKYDAYFVSAAASGIKIRLGFVPAGGVATNATSAGGCGLTMGSTSVAQYIACFGPLITAAMNRWGSAIDSVQVLEEPLGEMASIQTFTVSETAAIITNFSALVKTAVPGEPVGAAYTGYSFPVAGPGPCGDHIDDCYWTDATSGAAAAALDFLVIDLFSGNCNQSGNSYALELNSFAANYLAHTGGKPVRVGQSDLPPYCPTTGISDQYTSYLGALDVAFQQAYPEWMGTIVPWASTQGISSFSVFCTLPLFYFTADQANDSCVQGSASGLAMASLAPTISAQTYDFLSLWPALSFQGFFSIQGEVTGP
jgi:hypothetical protein